MLTTLRRRLKRLQPRLRAGRRDVAALLSELQGERPAERWRAAQTLASSKIGPEEVAALAAALADPDPILRWQAGAALAASGTPAGRAALLSALASDDPTRQMAAADALRLLPADPEVGAALLAALDGSQGLLRQSLVEALAAHPLAEALPVLRVLLERDESWQVRRAAAVALGRLGDPAARDTLTACAQNDAEHPLVREAAEQALRRLPEPEGEEGRNGGMASGG